MSNASELALLVEAEARLDRELADARDQAAELERAAKSRIEAAERALAEELARERARVTEAIDRETAARLAAMEDEARSAIARFEAVRDDRAEAIASTLLDALIAQIHAEAPP